MEEAMELGKGCRAVVASWLNNKAVQVVAIAH